MNPKKSFDFSIFLLHSALCKKQCNINQSDMKQRKNSQLTGCCHDDVLRSNDEKNRDETKKKSTTCCSCDDVLPECHNSSSHSCIFRVGNDEVEPTKQNLLLRVSTIRYDQHGPKKWCQHTQAERNEEKITTRHSVASTMFCLNASTPHPTQVYSEWEMTRLSQPNRILRVSTTLSDCQLTTLTIVFTETRNTD